MFWSSVKSYFYFSFSFCKCIVIWCLKARFFAFKLSNFCWTSKEFKSTKNFLFFWLKDGVSIFLHDFRLLVVQNGRVYAALRAFARNERHTHCSLPFSFYSFPEIENAFIDISAISLFTYLAKIDEQSFAVFWFFIFVSKFNLWILLN